MLHHVNIHRLEREAHVCVLVGEYLVEVDILQRHLHREGRGRHRNAATRSYSERSIRGQRS